MVFGAEGSQFRWAAMMTGRMICSWLQSASKRSMWARDGDWRLVEELRAKQSRRGRAREALERAEREGADDGTIAALRQEVALQTSLRADYSQDEGEYSRFLDKDDWYERDRRRAMGLDRPD